MNFDWTDKNSVRWFLMLPTGHEGPYSLNDVIQKLQLKQISHESTIWAEGLTQPVSISVVLKNSQKQVDVLPDLPQDDVPPPPIPSSEEVEIIEIPPPPVESPKMTEAKHYLLAGLMVLGLGIFAATQWIKSSEVFKIQRYPKMTLDQHDSILRHFRFDGWDKKIFFKEYVPSDLSTIWLVSSGFQTCDVSATFESQKDKLIALESEKISFKTSGTLKDHVVEFSNFEFISGTKILPGMYEMDIKATNCSWDGGAAKLANLFTGPDLTYLAKMKVILYHKGATEFNLLLDKLLRKKMEADLSGQNQEDIFWQGLQEKFQTLMAVTLQIEQLLLDLVTKDSKEFNSSLRPAIDVYTQKYGQFLTNFVIANENYFNELSKSHIKNISKKRTYETTVKLTAKRIGLESMKIIEDLQALKKPKNGDISSFEKRVKNIFSDIKSEIEQKIIKTTEDRSL